MRIGGWRALSWVTVALFLTGGALIVAAVAALPHPLTGGYISEAGVAGFARDGFYRAGMLAVSIGLLMLSAAARPAALALTAAGLL